MNKFTLTTIAIASISMTNTVFADTFHYAAIIDAGSSGSRIHLFQYEADKAIPAIKDIFSESIKPGLSSYSKNPTAAGESLKQLLDDAVNTLQKEHVDPKTVSVSVLATAGMRLLPTDSQQAIYDNVKNYIQDHYAFSIKQVATIPGQMEGLYGWLDVNYLAENFQHDTETLGSIDMGGASTQITFTTTDTTHPEDEMDIQVGKKSYHVFAKSFLGLGQDQSLATMNKDAAASSCYPVNYTMDQLVGNYDYATCSATYTNIIQQHHVVEEVVPHADQHFIVFSAAYYDYKFFNLLQTPDQSTVEQRVQSICSESWDQLQKDYPKENPKFLANYCANETYLDDLFYNTYQLNGSHIKITDKINDEDLDWTTGALLFQLANTAAH